MLVNVPLLNQITEKTNDGRRPEDGNMDCVPCSLAAMVRALDPGASLDGTLVSGDGLHDLAYGEGYTGMQDPARYVAILHDRFGVQMAKVTGSPQELVSRTLAELRAGHPVLLAIPSDWGDEPPHSQYAHMIAACDVSADGSTLTAANPWPAANNAPFYQTQPLAWWEERLAHCSYSPIWVLSREEPAPVSNVPLGWSDNAASGVLTAPNKQVVVRGFRDYLLSRTPVWYSGDVPLAAERADPSVNGGVWQQFRYSILRWNAKAGVTEQDRLTVLQGQLDAATAQMKTAGDALAKEQDVAAALSKEAADLNTQLSAANARLTQLSGVVTSLVTVVNALIAAVSKNPHNAQA